MLARIRTTCLALAAAAGVIVMAGTSVRAQAPAQPAQNVPQPPQSQPAQSWVGPVQIRDIEPANYYHIAVETTMGEVAQVAERAVPELMKAIAEGNVEGVGPLVLVYPQLTPDMGQPITVQIGYIVGETAQASGQYKVRKLEPLHCASVFYTGPIFGVGQAYQTLIPAMMAQGSMPAGESRQYFLYFEKPESNNNVVWTMMAVR